MNPDYVKYTLNTIISLSVAKVAREIIRNNVGRDTIQVKITSLVIGDIVFEYIWQNTDMKLDVIKAWALSTKRGIDEARAPAPSEEGLV